MGLLTSLLTEHMRGKREKQAAEQSNKAHILLGALNNENLPDTVHQQAWTEIEKMFPDMKPVTGILRPIHGQLKQGGQDGGQGAPQLPQVPGMPSMDVSRQQTEGPPQEQMSRMQPQMSSAAAPARRPG